MTKQEKQYLTCFKCHSTIMLVSYTGISPYTKKHMIEFECAKCGWDIAGIHIEQKIIDMLGLSYEKSILTPDKKLDN